MGIALWLIKASNGSGAAAEVVHRCGWRAHESDVSGRVTSDASRQLGPGRVATIEKSTGRRCDEQELDGESVNPCTALMCRCRSSAAGLVTSEW